jgi:hypothetical protein
MNKEKCIEHYPSLNYNDGRTYCEDCLEDITNEDEDEEKEIEKALDYKIKKWGF